MISYIHRRTLVYMFLIHTSFETRVQIPLNYLINNSFNFIYTHTTQKNLNAFSFFCRILIFVQILIQYAPYFIPAYMMFQGKFVTFSNFINISKKANTFLINIVPQQRFVYTTNFKLKNLSFTLGRKGHCSRPQAKKIN